MSKKYIVKASKIVGEFDTEDEAKEYMKKGKYSWGESVNFELIINGKK